MDETLKIIDIGASGGIDQRWFSNGFKVNAILFEPDPDAFEQLIKKKRKNDLILDSALSDKEKEIVFNICNWQQVSSIYEPNMDILKLFKNPQRWEIKKKITMKTFPLNDVLKKNSISEIDFMKIDTQGSELEILRGGTDYLDSIIGLEVESEFIEIYKNQPLFPEVDKFIQSNGFKLIDMRRTFWKRNIGSNGINKGQLIFADLLYMRTPESVLNIKGINSSKVIKAIKVYLTYGYQDLSIELLNHANNQGIIEDKDYNRISNLIKISNSKTYLPNFMGKGRIHNILSSLANVFQHVSFSSGTDSKLGN